MAVSKRAVGPQREPRAAGAALHRDKTIEGFTWRMLACPCLSGASHSSTGGQVQKHQALSNVFGGALNRLARLKPARSDPCLLLQ